MSADDFCVPCRAHELAATIWWQRPDTRRRAGKALGWLLRLTYRVPDQQRCASHKQRRTWTSPKRLHDLDDVIRIFGFTREELEAEIAAEKANGDG